MEQAGDYAALTFQPPPRRHPGAGAAIQFRDSARGALLVELRIGGSAGAQTIFPGSVHNKTGEAIEWAKDGKPAKADGATLQSHKGNMQTLCPACRRARESGVGS